MDLDCSDINTSNSPPRRRRSTFFERRDTLVPPQDDNPDMAIKPDSKTEYLSEIKNYNEELSKEKEAWKNEARQRRLKYFDTKSLVKAATSTSIDYSVLTTEDIEFLKAKPNIAKIAETTLELHKQVTVTMHLMKRLKALNEKVLSRCEDRVDDALQYMLQNSIVEPQSVTMQNEE